MNIVLAGKCLIGAAAASLVASLGINKIILPKILFQPPGSDPIACSANSVLPFSQVKTSSHVWYEWMPFEQKSEEVHDPVIRCIVFLHGNACTATSAIPFLVSLSSVLDSHSVGNKKEYHYYIPEYPEYGSMKDLPSLTTSDTYDVLEQFFRRIRHKYSEIIVIGQSLGTHFATRLAATDYCEQLILISPFSSVSSLVRHHVGSVCAAVTSVFEQYDTAYFMHRLPRKVKVCLVHGTADALIPYSESEMLRDTRRLSKWIGGENDRLVPLTGVHHNDIPLGEVINIISQFIQ